MQTGISKEKFIVHFVIEKDGRIGSTEIFQSAHPLLDEEAVRVVKMLPNWIPAEKDGNPVRCWFSIPITFKLSDEDNSLIAESERFITLGEKALKDNNYSDAFYYYKEAFDIQPSQIELLDKCIKLISNDTEKQNKFYEWAIDRILREIESDNSLE